MNKELTMREHLASALKFNIETYRNDGNVHYSTLSSLSDDPRKIDPSREREVSEAMNLGTAFDLAVASISEFRATYYAAVFPAPTHTAALLAEILIADDEISTTDEGAIEGICKANNFWKSYNAEKRRELYSTDNFIQYVEEQRRLSKIDQEFILEYAQYNDIISKANKVDEYIQSMYGTSDEVEILYQPQYSYEYNLDGEIIKISVMFDVMIVNYTKKHIDILDTKYFSSGKSASNWKYGINKYRYDIQFGLYSVGVQKLLQGFDDWTFSRLIFLIACPADDRLYACTFSALTVTKIFDGYSKNDNWYTGINELIIQLNYHRATEQYDYPMDYVNNGNLDILTL